MTAKQQDWQLRADIALDTAIASRRLITYSNLADAAQIPAPHRIQKLVIWLETQLEADYQSAKPLRAAWVISRHRGQIPAPGFFMKCHALGLYNGPYKGKQAATFHRNLLG